MSNDENSPSESDEIVPWIDSLDRFEREIDIQIEALNSIDDKAQYTARLIGLFLGLVLTVISLAPRFTGVTLRASSPTLIAFGVGLAGLVAAIVGAVITYLSSRFKTGLDPVVAEGLATYSVSPLDYKELLLRAYARALEQNKEVLDVNATRFRMTLSAFLVGIVFLALSFFLFVIAVSTVAKGVLLVLTGLVMFGILVYILSGGYLTIQG